jgi:phage terminase Nu1 subunit (DNA packaging protein)
MTKKNQRELSDTAIDAGAVVRLVMATCSASDEGLIRAALGDVVLSSMSEVAQSFGVSAATVRHTWRRDGLPGTVRRGPGRRGHFPLADIVLWLLKREQAARAGRAQTNNGHPRSDADCEELAAIELESARLSLEMQRSKAALMRGNMIDVPTVRAEIGAALSVFRDRILDLPQFIRPVLPARAADVAAAECDRICRHALTHLAENLSSAIEQRTKGEQNGKYD